jgi:predicted Zn finger-like uncharacterized protein
MTHLIECPECSTKLQVPEELLGKHVQCPECKHTFTAELPEGPPSEAPSQKHDPERETKKPGTALARVTRRRRDDEDDDDDDEDEDEDEDDENYRRRRSRRDEVPGKVTGIAIMALIGGIMATLLGVIYLLTFGASTCGVGCLWPGFYYSVVAGIMAIIKGSTMLGNDVRSVQPPTGIAIMLIINIINADVLSVTLGILMLVFCSDEEVTAYLAP